MDVTQTLRAAKNAIRCGNLSTARKLLTEFVQTHPRNETAWLWLSAIVEDPIREQECLEQVLNINPGNTIAWNHLVRLEQAETF